MLQGEVGRRNSNAILSGKAPHFAHLQAAYRSDIDGLRAVAVLSVMAFHYGAAFPRPILRGGFTGVDVFFVISGFLITSGVASDIRSGSFSLLSFYDRRVRRILPALIGMLAVTLFISRFMLMPGDYASLGVSAGASAFGISNFFLLAHTGYFDRASDLMPLLHTWSLAVEEQFYLVWPLLLSLVLTRWRNNVSVSAILGGVVIIGFGLNLLWFARDPKSAFFMAAPRAWELGIGALLVFLPPLPRQVGEITTALGLIVIVAGFTVVKAPLFPGVAALYPCVGAALVIWPSEKPNKAASWLGRLSPIGQISYSLYLWHWPVWVLFRIYINNRTPEILETIMLAVISITFAFLSFRFLEQPFRRRYWPPHLSIWSGLGVCMMTFCVGMYVDSADGLPSRIPTNLYAMRNLDVMWEWPCKEQIMISNHQYCAFGAPWAISRRGVLWGDSHAAHLVPTIDAVAREMGISFILDRSCPAALGHHLNRRFADVPSYAADCAEVRSRIIDLLIPSKIEFVVLAAIWSGMEYGIYTDNGEVGALPQLIQSGLADVIPDIVARGAKIVLVTDMTGPGFDMNPCIVGSNSGLLRRRCEPKDIVIDSQERHLALGPMTETLSALVQGHVQVLRPIDTMCDKEKCLNYLNSEFLFRDASHLRRNLSDRTNRELGRLLGFDQAFANSHLKADSEEPISK